MFKRYQKWLLLASALGILGISAIAHPIKADETTSYYQLIKQDEGTDIRVTFAREKGNDQVTKQSTENRILYKTLQDNSGIKSLEKIKEKLKDSQKNYNAIKGVNDQLTFKSNYVLEILTIDYKKADINDVRQLSGAQTTVSKKDKSGYVSYEETTKSLKENGFKEVKKGQFKTLKELKD